MIIRRRRKRREQEDMTFDLQPGDSHVVHMVHPAYHRYGARIELAVPPWSEVLLMPYKAARKQVRRMIEAHNP